MREIIRKERIDQNVLHGRKTFRYFDKNISKTEIEKKIKPPHTNDILYKLYTWYYIGQY